jgi:hypothetical protein
MCGEWTGNVDWFRELIVKRFYSHWFEEYLKFGTFFIQSKGRYTERFIKIN